MFNAEGLDAAIRTVVAPSAEEVDRTGAYPRNSLDALAEAGVLGVVVEDGLEAAAHVIRELAKACGSTAMITLMHYSAAAAIAEHGPKKVVDDIVKGRHLTTLALSEAGSRSHFWAPMSSAKPEAGGTVRLDAAKSWATSAGEVDSYVWSSRPVTADGAPMTLWLVPADAPGLTVDKPFDGLGLRGNASSPVTADGVVVDETTMLGLDGGGLDIALGTVLPVFLVLSAAFSVGLMEATVDEAATHLTTTRLAHLDQSLAEQAVTRRDLAVMRIRTDAAAALLGDTLTAITTGRPDAQLRVLEVKAAAAEAAIEVTDKAMTVCGGSAFRKELGIERRFRDARAARVMAPTTDALYDFVGRAITGQPLFDGPG